VIGIDHQDAFAGIPKRIGRSQDFMIGLGFAYGWTGLADSRGNGRDETDAIRIGEAVAGAGLDQFDGAPRIGMGIDDDEGKVGRMSAYGRQRLDRRDRRPVRYRKVDDGIPSAVTESRRQLRRRRHDAAIQLVSA